MRILLTLTALLAALQLNAADAKRPAAIAPAPATPRAVAPLPALVAPLRETPAASGETVPVAPPRPVAREVREIPTFEQIGVRIKDVAEVLGVRDNQIVGQGIIVGLEGTGDKTGVLAPQALANFISRMGLNIPALQLKPKNIAVVAVTAQLPPFAKKGAKLDVQISSLGDATSLQGGILIQTPLQGADGRVYAVAQGAISIGGFSAGTGGGGGEAAVQKNHTLAGRIPNGALVEREVITDFVRAGAVRLVLRQADFSTAQRMAVAISARWPGSAKAIDPYTVEFKLPVVDNEEPVPMALLAELESLRFVPDARARVVINERTGTIVAGAAVRLMPTVLSHGNLYITVKQTPIISQPEPFSKGETVVVSDASVGVLEENGRAIVLQHGPTLGDLAAALNALKVKPRDIIAIFQALKEAGALNAELVIM